jgi:methyltransferase (TIGR00027 family)
MTVDDEVVRNTATGAAFTREAHRILDEPPWIFDDPFAARFLDPGVEDVIRVWESMASPEAIAGIRSMIVGRARYVEDRLTLAARRGVRQYVILGAGLDSFAYRNNLGVDVYELDLASVQEWKRQKAESAGLVARGTLVHVPIDFENESCIDVLRRTTFDLDTPSFASWVGVTPYLTHQSIAATLRSLASLGEGSEIVLSYVVPREMWDPSDKALADSAIPAAESRGEPVRTFYRPNEIERLLIASGLSVLEHFGRDEAARLPLFHGRKDRIQPQGFERYVSAIART